MNHPYRDVLPGHVTVLVDQHSVGHRRGSDGAVCGTGLRLVTATVTQCAGWRVMPCLDCWQGRRPW